MGLILFLLFLWAGLHAHGFVAFLLLVVMAEVVDSDLIGFLFIIWLLMVMFSFTFS